MAAVRKRKAQADSPLDLVPPPYQRRFAEIVELIDAFCDRFLNDEYKEVCQKMAVCLCQDGSPVLSGKAAGWAAGFVYAVGRVNFLTDPNQQPHMRAEEIAEGFGISPATMHAKSRTLLTGTDWIGLQLEFTVASRLEDNPLIWILRVNGFMMDIRDAPRDAQVVAFEKGLIPYIPADRERA